MRARERIYEGALRSVRAVLGQGWGHGGLARALEGRRVALPHLEAWARRARTGEPLVLVHAPSVGEALMAQAIIAAARAARPRLQVVFTFFSPSAERIAARTGADVWSYLPWDTRADALRLLDALRPETVAFVRTEIWPVLGAAAAQRGIRTVLVNAVLAAGSSRLSPGARFLLGPAYRRLDAIGAVALEDASRFERFGVSPARVHVTGDARFDQVAERIRALDRASPLLARLRRDRLTLVAGSTWPADEEALAGALGAMAPGERPRLVIAPHQPTPEHLAGAERTLRNAGIEVQRLAALERDASLEPEAVLVDRVGVLADLYAIADLAYVGGGFGTAGLHSVVEPAALGVPVLFGPRHGNAREAAELVAAGGGAVVEKGTVGGRLTELVATESLRRRMGGAAAAFVHSRLGGAAANAALLLSPPPDRS